MSNKTFISWLPLAVGGTVIFFVLYVLMQQSYRQAANDPQISLAEDAALTLANGFPAESLFQSAPKTDMSLSKSPFGMVFDDVGILVSTSANYAGALPPTPPAGIFDYVKANGEDRVTWQTSSGLRFAAVAVPWKSNLAASSTPRGAARSGYLLVARSLHDTESRVDQLGWITLLGWLGFLFLTFILKMGGVYANESMKDSDDSK